MDSFAGGFRVMIHDTILEACENSPFIKFLLVEISV